MLQITHCIEINLDDILHEILHYDAYIIDKHISLKNLNFY